MQATFGMGCFWHSQEAFRQEAGVTKTTVGFMGGDVPDPGYEQVSSGGTGHAEVVQVEYDPEAVSYGELLRIFWEHHDPTQRDRQGPDIGRQYRSVIFFHSAEQRQEAEESRESRQQALGKPVATEVVPAGEFYPAEEYHQRYLQKRGLDLCPR